MAAAPRILLLLDANKGYNREVARGVARHARIHDLGTALVERMIPSRQDLRGFGAVGAVAVITSEERRRAIKRLGIPVVNVSTWLTDLPLGAVVPDNRAIGRMAAEYFLDRGFRHFAFYAYRNAAYAKERAEGFEEPLAERGLRIRDLRRDRLGRGWREKARRLGEHLCKGPFPLAAFAADDEAGRHFLEVCRRGGLDVPEMVSVLGVDNDELICELATPELSSIATQAERIGYEAAALLVAILEAEADPLSQLLVQPRGVVTRRSTDVIALADPEVASAFRYIRGHAAEPIGVSEVAGACSLSRRTLERRFRRELGHSPAKEIRKQHLSRAKWLLAFTDWNLAQVAGGSGFRSFRHLADVFRSDLGMSPTAYRREARL